MTPKQIIEGNKLIAAFMGYVYYEDNISYLSWESYTNIYSKVPIAVEVHNDEKVLKMFPNPDFGKANPEKWNNEIALLGWGTLNYGKYLTELNYDKSWDDLMQVIDKIESFIPITVSIFHRCCDIDASSDDVANWRKISIENISKIEAVWLAVVEFIKWYNKNK